MLENIMVSERSRSKRQHITLFHLYETSTIDKSAESMVKVD